MNRIKFLLQHLLVILCITSKVYASSNLKESTPDRKPSLLNPSLSLPNLQTPPNQPIQLNRVLTDPIKIRGTPLFPDTGLYSGQDLEINLFSKKI